MDPGPDFPGIGWIEFRVKLAIGRAHVQFKKDFQQLDAHLNGSVRCELQGVQTYPVEGKKPAEKTGTITLPGVGTVTDPVGT